MFDVLIRHATIIDGTRAPRFSADIGVLGDRIDSIGDLSAAQARQTIDATGLVAAPGFIDVHTHADGWLLKSPHLLPKTLQGFTTEVLMADGISYAPVTPQTWARLGFLFASRSMACRSASIRAGIRSRNSWTASPGTMFKT